MSFTRAEEQNIDATLDITAETCPMTFVRVRLALDRMAPGQVLLVRLKGAEPLRNVPRTATEQGHAVLRQQPDGEAMLLWLRKGGSATLRPPSPEATR
jgi:tRNA 2-thiouridine synthesizing protein A